MGRKVCGVPNQGMETYSTSDPFLGCRHIQEEILPC